MLKILVNNCWVKDPNVRPDMNAVCAEIKSINDQVLCSAAQNTYAQIEVQETGDVYNVIELLHRSYQNVKEEKPDDA